MRAFLSFACALTLSASSATAHHAISAYYDNGKRATIEGVVSRFQFVSPHPFVLIDVDGKPWRLEMDNRSELMGIGIRSDTLKAGDRIVISGSLARDEPQRLYVLHLTRPADGFTYEQVGGTPRIVKWKK